MQNSECRMGDRPKASRLRGGAERSEAERCETGGSGSRPYGRPEKWFVGADAHIGPPKSLPLGEGG